MGLCQDREILRCVDERVHDDRILSEIASFSGGLFVHTQVPQHILGIVIHEKPRKIERKASLVVVSHWYGTFNRLEPDAGFRQLWRWWQALTKLSFLVSGFVRLRSCVIRQKNIPYLLKSTWIDGLSYALLIVFGWPKLKGNQIHDCNREILVLGNSRADSG